MEKFNFINAESNVLAGQLAGYSTDFSDSKLWEKLRRVFKRIGEELLFNVLLLYYVMESDDVPLKDKALIVGALGYFICPIDFIPDVIPVAGYTDDLAAILAVVQTVSAYATPEIVAKANSKAKSYFG